MLAPRVVVVALLVLAPGCKRDGAKRIEEAQKKRNAEKKAYEDAKEAKAKSGMKDLERAQLEPFWDAPEYRRVTNGRPCPDGLWSLFPETPGEGAEQQANEAKRAALLEQSRAATFVAVLHAGSGVEVRPYNAKKKRITVEVDGLVECTDGLGVVSLAWGDPAKPYREKQPDDDEGELPMTSVWRAQPLVFHLPFATAAEAKAFLDANRVSLDARLVFTLGKVELDKKMHKAVSRDDDAPPQMVDYGAGRLAHVTLTGVRLATDHEKTQLAEQRKK
ncbi:MAG: hypothetical protein JNG84_12955 [Archangium sp.]|nr:hypothetical protein [Archangium sp.]